jgi:hypothetical protein
MFTQYKFVRPFYGLLNDAFSKGKVVPVLS